MPAPGQARLAAARFTHDRASSAARTVVEAIRPHAKDTDVIHPQMNLEFDLGLDSLARAEVFAALENAFETEFTAEQAGVIATSPATAPEMMPRTLGLP